MSARRSFEAAPRMRSVTGSGSVMLARMRPNWFIALPVSPMGWFETLPAPPEATRLFAPADLHLTIAFLGDVDETKARASWAALAWPLPAMIATLGGVGPLGPKHRYSALSAALDEGREAVERAIATARVACCAAAVVTVDPRPALAHVTIARPQRRASDAERAAALAWAAEITLPKVPLRLDAAALYTWAEDRKDALFRIVERASLPISTR